MLILTAITLFTYSVLIKLALHSDAWVLNSSFLSLCLIPTITLLLAVIYLQASREHMVQPRFLGICRIAMDHPAPRQSRSGGWLGRRECGFNLKVTRDQSAFYNPHALDVRTCRNV